MGKRLVSKSASHLQLKLAFQSCFPLEGLVSLLINYLFWSQSAAKHVTFLLLRSKILGEKNFFVSYTIWFVLISMFVILLLLINHLRLCHVIIFLIKRKRRFTKSVVTERQNCQSGVKNLKIIIITKILHFTEKTCNIF